jgi:hypothetical protein
MIRETACDCCASMGFVVLVGAMCLAPWFFVYVARSGMLWWIIAGVAALFAQTKLGDLWEACERIKRLWLRRLLSKALGFTYGTFTLALLGGILLSVVS